MKPFNLTPTHIGFIVVFFLVTCGLLNSCMTTRKTNYLQEIEQSEYPTERVTPDIYRIQPNDNLFIRVITPDPTRSEMFNSLPLTTTSMSTDAQAVDLISYSVQPDGTVDIPYLGAIHVAGKTLAEARDILEKAMEEYLSDASLTVKLVNNFVSIIGEVNRPGLYPIYKEQMNIFQALSMAGDMADYSNRSSVKIVRKTPAGTVIKEFDLTDRNIIDSEFYFVMPNDVIYAQPIKGQFFRMNEFPYAVILSTLSTLVLSISYISQLRNP